MFPARAGKNRTRPRSNVVAWIGQIVRKVADTRVLDCRALCSRSMRCMYWCWEGPVRTTSDRLGRGKTSSFGKPPAQYGRTEGWRRRMGQRAASESEATTGPKVLWSECIPIPWPGKYSLIMHWLGTWLPKNGILCASRRGTRQRL